MALSCDLNNCSQYCWVYFDENHQGSYLGNSYQTDLDSYLKNLQFKLIYSEARIERILIKGLAGISVLTFVSNPIDMAIGGVMIFNTFYSAIHKNIATNKSNYFFNQSSRWMELVSET